MRLAAIAPLLLAACTAFDGAQADPIAEQSQTEPAGKGGANGEPGTAGAENGTGGGAMGKVDAPNPAASAPSCAQLHGGQTCGPDGKGDCCAITTQGGVKINKYMITAGRMRAFMMKTNGDVAGFVQTLPKDKWNLPTDGLPTDPASANVALGPQGKKACEQAANTGHTYWTPPTEDDFSDFDQSTLDEKALNCVPWQLTQALCAFDGGHLATVKDLHAAFTNDGSTKFPWGDDAVDTSTPDDKLRLNLEFGFETKQVPAKFRGDEGHPSEVSFFIAPPGSFPAGDNKSGVADAAGNLLEWVGDSPRQFVWKGDFEHHGADAAKLNALNGGSIWMDKEVSALGISLGGAWVWGNNQLAGNAGNASQKDGYYSIGGRCAF